jgi:23S rRNA (cytidine2498-2'-O)-methyltransferase
MHLILPVPDASRFLVEELVRAFPSASAAVAESGLVVLGGHAPEGPLVFARQCLPDATPFPVPSIRIAARALADALVASLPGDSPWRLHVESAYGSEEAGANRCRLIREAVLEILGRLRRTLRRGLDAATGRTPGLEHPPFSADESFVQLLLDSPASGFLSILRAPGPSRFMGSVWPFPKGHVPVAVDKAAPSRAFAKLVEAEARLGRRIAAGETCVDLGAAPGSWTYVPVRRGARVTAVDRAPLRDDMMASPLVEFVRGDAFRYEPPASVDWLLCDVIAAPERGVGLVLDWVRARRCRHFVVTVKFRGNDEYAKLDTLKRDLAPLASPFLLHHLCANKNEACVIGSLRD